VTDDNGPGAGPPGLQRLHEWLGGHLFAQIAVFVIAVTLGGLLSHTMLANMERVGMTPGFAFLLRPANFSIGESLIPYTSQDSLLRAIAVGILNTLLVSFLGCLFATILGVVLGIARLSSNPLLAGSVRVYVEVLRNTPLLLQLFFWSATIRALPAIRQALEPLPGVFLSNRGLFLPILVLDGAGSEALALAAFAALAAAVTLRFARRAEPSRRLAPVFLAIAALAGVILVATGGVALSVPAHKGFNMAGGVALTSEFSALLIGLALNAAAGIAEVVRSGIEAVPRGQWEAGESLGLRRGRVMRLIVLPQALRVIVPLMTSAWLTLTKNSSLAVAIGYPDLVNIVNTAANQTGQALEAIIVMVAVYLGISLSVSLAMNLYNARLAAPGR
jgi:general L-amino acid transport system permease protein